MIEGRFLWPVHQTTQAGVVNAESSPHQTPIKEPEDRQPCIPVSVPSNAHATEVVDELDATHQDTTTQPVIPVERMLPPGQRKEQEEDHISSVERSSLVKSGHPAHDVDKEKAGEEAATGKKKQRKATQAKTKKNAATDKVTEDGRKEEPTVEAKSPKVTNLEVGGAATTEAEPMNPVAKSGEMSMGMPDEGKGPVSQGNVKVGRKRKSTGDNKEKNNSRKSKRTSAGKRRTSDGKGEEAEKAPRRRSKRISGGDSNTDDGMANK